MNCDECGKNNAEVMITTIVNGESVTKHLCRQCVKKYQNGSIHGVLAAVLATMARKQQVEDAVCPTCGMHFSEFQKSGVLGCADCYRSFRSQLTDLLTRVQGRTQHAGKRPDRSEAAMNHLEELNKLRSQMEEAVRAEDYEKAALLRDQIEKMNREYDARRSTITEVESDE